MEHGPAVRGWEWTSASMKAMITLLIGATVVTTLHPCGGVLNCHQMLEDLQVNVNPLGIWDTNSHLAGFN
jgi:hypothetical protein